MFLNKYIRENVGSLSGKWHCASLLNINYIEKMDVHKGVGFTRNLFRVLFLVKKLSVLLQIEKNDIQLRDIGHNVVCTYYFFNIINWTLLF